MGKKIFGIYLAKLDAPNSEAHARLELPASPLELHDAMDKVRLQENEEVYLEIDDYYGFEYLCSSLEELDASLNELNDLAGRLAVLDETEQEAFDGLLRLEISEKGRIQRQYSYHAGPENSGGQRGGRLLPCGRRDQ